MTARYIFLLILRICRGSGLSTMRTRQNVREKSKPQDRCLGHVRLRFSRSRVKPRKKLGIVCPDDGAHPRKALWQPRHPIRLQARSVPLQHPKCRMVHIDASRLGLLLGQKPTKILITLYVQFGEQTIIVIPAKCNVSSDPVFGKPSVSRLESAAYWIPR